MQQVILLVVAVVIGVAVFRLRSAAAGERKAVMARIADEREARGDYSPTAELFREAGVAVGSGSVAPPFVPTFERLSDLREDGEEVHDDGSDAAVDAAAPADDDQGDLLGDLGIAALDLSPTGNLTANDDTSSFADGWGAPVEPAGLDPEFEIDPDADFDGPIGADGALDDLAGFEELDGFDAAADADPEWHGAWDDEIDPVDEVDEVDPIDEAPAAEPHDEDRWQPEPEPEPATTAPTAVRTGAEIARALLDNATLDDDPVAVGALVAPVARTALATRANGDGLDDLPAPEGAPVGDLPAPAGAPVGDLRTLYRGLRMPAGLKPLGPLEATQATFATGALPAVVRAALADEFDRLGCHTAWVETDVARTERNGQRGLVTVYPEADSATDPDGRRLFAGVAPGSVVVRMVAL